LKKRKASTSQTGVLAGLGRRAREVGASRKCREKVHEWTLFLVLILPLIEGKKKNTTEEDGGKERFRVIKKKEKNPPF